MAHNIEYYDYKENTDKKKIQADLDTYVEHCTWQEGGSGTGGIRWVDHICKDYDEAQKWIEQHDKGWYDCLAVKYYSPLSEKTKKIEELNARIQETYKTYTMRDSTIYVKTRTSEFIGCSNCKSKLASKFLRTNFCPVCRADLRPETILKSIEAAKVKWQNAQQAKKDYVDKHSKKEVRWLVKIEYHT